MTKPEAARRKSNLGAVFLALGTAVVLSLAGYLVAAPLLHTEAESTVEDYLDALRSRDVDAAVAAAGIDRSLLSGEHGDFLSAKALSTDWEVSSVADLGEVEIDAENIGNHIDADALEDNGGAFHAHPVAVTITHGSAAARGILYVVTTNGRARIVNPLTYVAPSRVRLPYLGLNDVNAPYTPDADDDGGSTGDYPLFPGFYRPFHASDGLLDPGPAEMLVPPGSDEQLGLGVTPTAKAARAADRALRSRLDSCADAHEASPKNCPFTAVDAGFRDVVTDAYSWDHLKDAAWKVKRYPKGRLVFDDREGLIFANADDGELSFSAVGTNDDGKRRRFSVTCVVDLGAVRVSLSRANHLAIDTAAEALATPDGDFGRFGCTGEA